MNTKPARGIAHLRKMNFKQWATTLWLVKRHLVGQIAHYSVLRVDVDRQLQSKLKNAVVDRIQGADYKLEEYDFLTADSIVKIRSS